MTFSKRWNYNDGEQQRFPGDKGLTIKRWREEDFQGDRIVLYPDYGTDYTNLYRCIHLCLPLGRKSVTNLDSALKSRNITLPTKVHLVKAMVFPVVMYGCESWAIEKTECWRIDALNCSVGEDSWESLGLQGDQTSQSLKNQLWIFIGRTDAEAETPIHWPPDMKNWLFTSGKTLLLGKTEGRRRGQQKMRWLDGITNSMEVSSRSWLRTGKPGVL